MHLFLLTTPCAILFAGGNYQTGSGNGELYNGEYLAEKHNAIYIGVNYRLGILGYLASAKHGIDGNYGIYDSAAALAFVQVFGPGFGGDVSRVTAWGQSAGSMTIPMLTTYGFDTYYHETLYPAYKHLRPCKESEITELQQKPCDVAKGKSRRANRDRMRMGYLQDLPMHLRPQAIGSDDGLYHVTQRDSFRNVGLRSKHASDSSCSAKWEAVYEERLNTCGENLFFTQAHLESNPFTLPIRTGEELQNVTDAFIGFIGCNSTRFSPVEQLVCARNVSADAIMAGQKKVYSTPSLNKRPLTQFMVMSPAMRTVILPIHPYRAILENKIREDVRFMLGTTIDEGNLFIFEGFQKELDALGYYLLVGAVVGFDKVDEVVKRYPADSTQKDQRLVMSRLTSDIVFHCVNRNVSRIFASRESEHPNQAAYLYLYDLLASFMKETWPDQPECWTACCHGADLPMWHHVGWPKYFMPTANEVALSELMVRYQANFIASGDPNNAANAEQKATVMSSSSYPHWPKFDAATSQLMHLNKDNSQAEGFFRNELCDFFDSYTGYAFADPQ